MTFPFYHQSNTSLGLLLIAALLVSAPSWAAEAKDEPVAQGEVGEQPEAAQDQTASDKSPDEVYTEPGDLSFWQRSADWLIDYRNDISLGIDNMARGIDRFFAGNEALQDENKSFMRIRAGAQFVEGDGLKNVSDLKFRLSLPATQRKYRLVIENDTDDDESIEERNRPSTTSEDSRDESQFSAAFQYISKEADRWDTKAELGIRASTPLDPFVRHTAKRRWDLDGPWSARFRQQIAYHKVSGYRGNEELKFERRLNDNWFFRTKTEVDWREEVDSMRAAQVFTFVNRISDEIGIDYRFGTIAHSLHHTVINNSFITIDYRQLLYDDWLYLDVIPEITFPREDDYDPTSSLTMRLEVLFFE